MRLSLHFEDIWTCIYSKKKNYSRPCFSMIDDYTQPTEVRVLEISEIACNFSYTFRMESSCLR